jgi:lysyl-tRNA synthetase class 2
VATTGRAPTADLRDLVDGPDDLDQRELCDLVWAEVVQPAFSGFTIVDRWPADQAAQATIHADGSAARFELYVDGLELANGYQECTDSAELRQRMGGGIHDEAYLAAVEHLPPCSGVAVGFDRVVMLALGLAEISDSRC